ncbi:TolC family protein [Polluticoccus soli]|uniref:TolC family protein n=1 Tax=Polluticoccus soli TaxID=3034150 RepID=UPI0023E21A82|nr:TolC family protein [Flavipsychrobacter sp. JY13-12]
MRHPFFVAVLLFTALCQSAPAQDTWSLQQSVKYALEHNISIQQNVLNERLAKLTLQQSRLSQLPNLNVSGNYGRSFGRSVDPTTNQFVSGDSYDFTGTSGNADVLLFGWFQKRYTIVGNKLRLDAAGAELDQLKDDVSLNVATGYLRALLAQEQVTVSEKQVELSKARLEQTRKFADAGRVPELDVAQMESQLASDSANLITAMADYTSAILDIKALLNLDFATPYGPEIPQVTVADEKMLLTLTPEEIYDEATRHLGVIRSRQLRLAAAEKNRSSAWGALWPTVALSAQAGTNYSTTVRDVKVTGATLAPVTGAYAYDALNNTQYQIFQSSPTFSTTTTRLVTQFDNNFRQTVALTLSVPIFNAWQGQYGLRQSRINVLSEQLNKYQAELKLKQDVYRAYNDARNALQKYYAALRAFDAAKRAFDFAQKRYDIGLTNTVDYLTVQNSLYASASRFASTKYELIFKMKVIDYYLGKELKL